MTTSSLKTQREASEVLLCPAQRFSVFNPDIMSSFEDGCVSSYLGDGICFLCPLTWSSGGIVRQCRLLCVCGWHLRSLCVQEPVEPACVCIDGGCDVCSGREHSCLDSGGEASA